MNKLILNILSVVFEAAVELADLVAHQQNGKLVISVVIRGSAEANVALA